MTSQPHTGQQKPHEVDPSTETTPPGTAPPETTPTETTPPGTAPPETAPPETAPPETAPPETGPAEAGPLDREVSVRLGLIADPDFPELLVERLQETLAEQLNQSDLSGCPRPGSRSWVVEVQVDPITAGRAGSVEMLRATGESARRHGWDYAICVTDLPVRLGRRPVLAEASLDQHTAVLSLPAVGGLAPFRRSRQLIALLLTELTDGGPHQVNDTIRALGEGLRSQLTALLGPIRRRCDTVEDEVDVRYVASPLRGRARLLSGMVRTNRPWRLVFGLSHALAAAVAISAFGLSSSTIWQVADRLDVPRRIGGTAISVLALTIWLITAHRLWEHRRTRHRHRRDREQVLLYNASTLATLLLGAAVLYAVLYVIDLAMVGFFLDTGLLATALARPVGPGTFLALAWGFTTIGTFGGALGSTLESDDAVRQAAYGYREEQRRRDDQQLDAHH